MKTGHWLPLSLAVAPAAAIPAIAMGAGIFGNVTMDKLTRDLAAIAGVHPLYGSLSSLGILLWCAAATACLLAAWVVRPVAPAKIVRFLVGSGLLSGWLLFDDLFLFHEELAARYLGIPEKAVFGTLGLLLLAYLTAYRQVLATTRWAALLLALAFLAASATVDLASDLQMTIGHWAFLVEDGLKWVGICFWCSYYVTTAGDFLSASRRTAGVA